MMSSNLPAGTVTFLFTDNESDFNSLWAEGRALTMEQAIEFALN
jgi:hypothetical protein